MFVLLLLLAADPEMVRMDASTVRIEDSGTGLAANARIGAFEIGRTEVTQAEYRRVTGLSPSQKKGDQLPVESVSWHDAVKYANRRSALDNLRPCYTAAGLRVPGCNGYRLPTQAEWSIAAKTPGDLTTANLRKGNHKDTASLTSLAGTREVAVGTGPVDLFGNVWEWCEDWYSPEPLLDSLRDPQGPTLGNEKVIRGGSYLSTAGAFNKGFVSSFPPDRRSPFTGFRIARTLEAAAKLPAADSEWLKTFQRPPATTLPALSPASIPQFRATWTKILSLPAHTAQAPVTVPLRQFRESTWNGNLMDVQVAPGETERILVMEPVRKPAGRLPVVIVPFYDVDSPAGENLGGRRAGGGVRAFARLAVQRGFLAVAVRWFGESDGEGYEEAVMRLAQRHPGVTGLGKWISDSQRVIDYLATRPDVDMSRIGIIGHSLGGKMALYAAAFDPRIAVVVSSEPGIALGFTNYEDFWYLGKNRPTDHDQQELLALIAPRPFLLIAGESSDGEKSWPYLEAAKPIYREFGKELQLGMFNHKSGHSPSPESVEHSMDWLERFLR